MESWKWEKIRFWEDNWLGSSSLAIQFWPIYRIVHEKGKTIADVWDGVNLKCTFRRNFTEHMYQSWLDIKELIASVEITSEEDEMIWQFNSSGVYSSQSLYKIINFRGVIPVHVSAVWSIKAPPRVHYFLWLVINNRILTRDNLAKRREVEDECCLFCLEKESVHHVLFDCVVARQCWHTISEVLDRRIGADMSDIGKILVK